MQILVCNVGSTSLKYKMFEMPFETELCRGGIEKVGTETAFSYFQAKGADRVESIMNIADQTAAIGRMVDCLTSTNARVLESLGSLDAIAFKVVGADGISGTVILDEAVLNSMEVHTPLLPCHNPPYIEAIRIFARLVPHVPLIGLFETTFHGSLPEAAYTYGVPSRWKNELHLRRYGYHGASFTYINEQAAKVISQPGNDFKLIVCHLGGSSSICAIRNGKSIDTSMGMSNQAGVSMSNRCGDLDPFLLLYVMDRLELTTNQMREELTTNGGLAGISEMGGDVQELELAASKGHKGAQRALEVYSYEVKKYIGAYAAALGGLDALIFTGGIGENGCNMRARICDGLKFLGIEIHMELNKVQSETKKISPGDANVPVWVIPTNEEIVVARSALGVLRNSGRV